MIHCYETVWKITKSSKWNRERFANFGFFIIATDKWQNLGATSNAVSNASKIENPSFIVQSTLLGFFWSNNEGEEKR